MQELKINAGGRPRRVDDLKAIQDQLNDLQAIHGIGGSYIITGCEVSGLSIAAGYVFIDGKVLKFDGATASSFPYYISAATPADAVSDVSALAGVQVTQVLYKAQGSNTLPGGSFIMVNTTGGRALRDALGINAKAEKTVTDDLQAQVSAKQKNLPIGTQLKVKASILAKFDIATGLGTAEWAGWAIADGRNGTDDESSFFHVGYDRGKASTPADVTTQAYNYGLPGNTGGKDWFSISLAEMPVHNHVNGAYNQLLKTSGSGGGTVASTDNTPAEPQITSSAAIQSAGSGNSHENRPRYKVALFVEKIA